MDDMEATHHFETLKTVVRRHVIDAVTLAHGNQRQAAELLGLSRWTLGRLVKRLELRDLVTTIRREHQPMLRTAGAADASEVSRCGHDG